jgi:hypothetical protein
MKENLTTENIESESLRKIAELTGMIDGLREKVNDLEAENLPDGVKRTVNNVFVGMDTIISLLHGEGSIRSSIQMTNSQEIVDRIHGEIHKKMKDFFLRLAKGTTNTRELLEEKIKEESFNVAEIIYDDIFGGKEELFKGKKDDFIKSLSKDLSPLLLDLYDAFVNQCSSNGTSDYNKNSRKLEGEYEDLALCAATAAFVLAAVAVPIIFAVLVASTPAVASLASMAFGATFYKACSASSKFMKLSKNENSSREEFENKNVYLRRRKNIKATKLVLGKLTDQLSDEGVAYVSAKPKKRAQSKGKGHVDSLGSSRGAAAAKDGAKRR